MRTAAAGLFPALALALALAPSRAQQAPEETRDRDAAARPAKPEAARRLTKLRVRVTGGTEALPVASARVEVTCDEEGVACHKQARTNRDGNAEFDVPRCRVLVQVTAAHWNTGGVHPTLREQEERVVIALVKPN